MGQYHCIANLDTDTFYNPPSVGGGVKMLEQSCSYTTHAALVTLLATWWADTRVAVVGDYYETGDLPGTAACTRDELLSGFRNFGWYARKCLAAGTNAEITKRRSPVMHGVELYDTDTGPEQITATEDIAHVVMVSRDKREYIDLGAYLIGDPTLTNLLRTGWRTGAGTAIVAMIACSDGRGGGDLCSDNSGTWAGDQVAIIDAADVPGDYTNVTHLLFAEIINRADIMWTESDVHADIVWVGSDDEHAEIVDTLLAQVLDRATAGTAATTPRACA